MKTNLSCLVVQTKLTDLLFWNLCAVLQKFYSDTAKWNEKTYDCFSLIHFQCCIPNPFSGFIYFISVSLVHVEHQFVEKDFSTDQHQKAEWRKMKCRSHLVGKLCLNGTRMPHPELRFRTQPQRYVSASKKDFTGLCIIEVRHNYRWNNKIK